MICNVQFWYKSKIKCWNTLGCLDQYICRRLRLCNSWNCEAVLVYKYAQRMGTVKQSGLWSSQGSHGYYVTLTKVSSMHLWENWIWNWIEICPLVCLIWNGIALVSSKPVLCFSFTVIQLHVRVCCIQPPYINSILIYVCTISCSCFMQFSPFSHIIIPYLYIFTSIFIVSPNSLRLILSYQCGLLTPSGDIFIGQHWLR